MTKRTGYGALALAIGVIAAVLIGSPKDTSAASATAQTFTVDQSTFNVQVAEGWVDVKDTLGMPVMLVGPETDEYRPVVSITPTGLEKFTLDEKAIKSTYGDYRLGRIQWLEERAGKLISFEKFTTESIGKQTAYVAGVNYEIDGKKFTERSYYFNCGKELYFIKSLVPEGANSKDAEKTVRSVSCSASG